MIQSIPFLTRGILFGLSAGISPGPLLMLVISETLKHNRRAGIMVAIAPAITDIPIVALSVFILTRLSNFSLIIGSISILGALFISYLAYESITIKGIDLDLQNVKAQSLRKGVITNFLNPHPYLFWMSIGAPTTLKAYSTSVASAFVFILVFYVCLVGSKVLLVIIVSKSKMFLKSSIYLYIIKLLGLVLLVFAVLFIKEGLAFWGII